ncbi:hypothetical protein [Candidatus Magnetomonas plexicatena]|uniref:hypothetical protein n=1 Tax=Candidatus Magnetomonas plexicatena TaxID=2552947 RepID=UPI0011043570|nr:hypothetical protein E2O03_012915 [Nitrospirales bacterium LBB_01]
MMLKKVIVFATAALMFALLFSTLLEAFPPPYPPPDAPPPRYWAPYPLPPAPPALYPLHRHPYVVPSVFVPVPVVEESPVMVETIVWVPWFPVPLWVVPHSGYPPHPWRSVP